MKWRKLPKLLILYKFFTYCLSKEKSCLLMRTAFIFLFQTKFFIDSRNKNSFFRNYFFQINLESSSTEFFSMYNKDFFYFVMRIFIENTFNIFNNKFSV